MIGCVWLLPLSFGSLNGERERPRKREGTWAREHDRDYLPDHLPRQLDNLVGILRRRGMSEARPWGRATMASDQSGGSECPRLEYSREWPSLTLGLLKRLATCTLRCLRLSLLS